MSTAAQDVQKALTDPALSRQERLALLSRYRPLSPNLGRIMDAVSPGSDLTDMLDQWLNTNTEATLPSLLGHGAAMGPWWTPNHLSSLTPYLTNQKLDPILSLHARALLHYTSWGSTKGSFDTARIWDEAMNDSSRHHAIVEMILAEPWLAQQITLRDVGRLLASDTTYERGQTALILAKVLYANEGILPHGDVRIEMSHLRICIRKILKSQNVCRTLDASDFTMVLDALGKPGLRVFIEDTITDATSGARPRHWEIPPTLKWLAAPTTPLQSFGPDWVDQQLLRLTHALEEAPKNIQLQLHKEVWSGYDQPASHLAIPVPAATIDRWAHAADSQIRALIILNLGNMRILAEEEERRLNERVFEADERRWASDSMPELATPKAQQGLPPG
jgi:hypothetical protein